MNDFNYKKMIVWQKSLEVTKQIYSITEKLPKSEEYGLRNQIRRAVVSVSSNIAEGSARKSEADRKRFYSIARSSVIEIDCQLELSIALKYVKESDCTEVNSTMLEVFKILTKLTA